MICLTVAPGLAAQSKAALPELSPSTKPRAAHFSLPVNLTLRLLAMAWISQGSQTLRKSMKSGGLPPVSWEKASMVRMPWTSASVPKGMGAFLPVWSKVLLNSDSMASATGRGMPRAVGAPLQLAHEARRRRR